MHRYQGDMILPCLKNSNLLNSHCKIPENRTPMENKIIHLEKNYGSAHAVSCPINSVRQYII